MPRSGVPGSRAWLLFAIFSSAVTAQVAPPRTEPLPFPGTPPGPSRELELKAPAAAGAQLALDGPVQVNGFRLSGTTALSEPEAASVLSPWIGRLLDATELARAADALTGYLRAKGYLVAQAIIPPQTISDGVVEIVVLEGRIGQIALEVPADARVRSWVVERFVGQLHAGDTIRRDNVEHSLLLLNDLPGVRLGASFASGAQAGTADVIGRLENDGNRIAGTLTVDNAGLRGVGEYRANLELRLRSPLGIGDLVAARVLQSSEGGQTVAALTYGLPVNGSGTRLGARATVQRYRLGREFVPLQAHGESSSLSLLATHPLVRRSDHNLSVSLSYTESAFHDRQDAVGFISDSKQRVAVIGMAADSRDGWLGGGASALQVQYLSGRVLLDSPLLLALDAPPGGLGVNGRFSALRLRAQRLQSIDARSALQLSISAQAASKNLDAGNELAIGGPDAVRAYPVGELYADQGYVARAEYRRGLALPVSGRTEGSLFFDTSRVSVNRNPLPGDAANKRSLRGYGFGLFHAPGRDLSIQAWLAWKASEDRPTAAPARAPRIWLSAAASF